MESYLIETPKGTSLRGNTSYDICGRTADVVI